VVAFRRHTCCRSVRRESCLLDAGRLGRRSLLVDGSPARAAVQECLRFQPSLADTTVPVLDPGRGRTKTGRLWVYAREQRPWYGPEPPAAVFLFAPDRKAERPASHLENFKGVLHVDGYAGFEQLPPMATSCLRTVGLTLGASPTKSPKPLTRPLRPRR
jgi:hypothetical protein